MEIVWLIFLLFFFFCFYFVLILQTATNARKIGNYVRILGLSKRNPIRYMIAVNDISWSVDENVSDLCLCWKDDILLLCLRVSQGVKNGSQSTKRKFGTFYSQAAEIAYGVYGPYTVTASSLRAILIAPIPSRYIWC